MKAKRLTVILKIIQILKSKDLAKVSLLIEESNGAVDSYVFNVER